MDTPPPDPTPNRCINVFVHYDLPVDADIPEESYWGTEQWQFYPGIIAETLLHQWEWVDLHFERPFPDCHGKTTYRILAVDVDERERVNALKKRRKRPGK